ncbi:MAG: hypothetical protein AB1633_00880 [Elusimicrobiota bacterium]
MPLNDITMLVFAASFIVILIILLRISSQIDTIVKTFEAINRKIRENYDVIKWDFEMIKNRFTELTGKAFEDYAKKKAINDDEIDWKG